MHGTTFVSYSRFAVAANLRGRGLSQSSCSCYSETAPFQDGKQSQMHSHGFSSAIATTKTSPGLGGYATCRFLVLADGLPAQFITAAAGECDKKTVKGKEMVLLLEQV